MVVLVVVMLHLTAAEAVVVRALLVLLDKVIKVVLVEMEQQIQLVVHQ
jgi:hypothetical protein